MYNNKNYSKEYKELRHRSRSFTSLSLVNGTLSNIRIQAMTIIYEKRIISRLLFDVVSFLQLMAQSL